MTDDLTTASYWGEQQRNTHLPADEGAIRDLLNAVEPFLRAFKHGRWLELGCSPGHVSSLLHRRVPFEPSGVDFSPEAERYLDSMRQIAGVEANLVRCDVREFHTDCPFDVVMSFGLVEHFADPHEILDHHNRLCRNGGLVVVAIPHFRRLQWLYHCLFDRPDLKRHNVEMMTPETFRTFGERRGLDILFLDYVGGMYFWNVDTSGPRPVALTRKVLSLAVRGATNKIISHLLPRGARLYAPWILFIARRT